MKSTGVENRCDFWLGMEHSKSPSDLTYSVHEVAFDAVLSVSVFLLKCSTLHKELLLT